MAMQSQAIKNDQMILPPVQDLSPSRILQKWAVNGAGGQRGEVRLLKEGDSLICKLFTEAVQEGQTLSVMNHRFSRKPVVFTDSSFFQKYNKVQIIDDRGVLSALFLSTLSEIDVWIQEWHIEDDKQDKAQVDLYWKGGHGLEYVFTTITPSEHVVRERIKGTENLTLEQLEEACLELALSEVVIEQDNSLTFMFPLYKCPVRLNNIKDKIEMQLLKRKDALILQLYSPYTQGRIQLSIDHLLTREERYDQLLNAPYDSLKPLLKANGIGTLPTRREFLEADNLSCEEVKDFIHALRGEPPSVIENRISFLDDLIVKGKVLYGQELRLPGYLTIYLYLEPKSEESRIDSRVLVSKFMWAVTLINISGSEGNHAIIVIEGLGVKGREGYSMEIAHLTTGRGVVSEQFDHSKNLKYNGRTQIWKVPSKKVQLMLDKIDEESKMKPKMEVDIYGRNSVFSDGTDSCFTWGREKLKILGVDLGTSWMEAVITRTKNFTTHWLSWKFWNKLSIPSDAKLI